MFDHVPHLDPEPSPVSLAASSETIPVQETLGNAHIMIDRPIFLDGYFHGYSSYMRTGRYLPLTATMLRDVLLKRVLGHPDQPGLWSTGYVLGWVTALQGLPRRQRLCSLDHALTRSHPPRQPDATPDPILADAVPSLFHLPDFQRGLTDGQQAYRSEKLFPDEPDGDHPSEDDLIHFFAGQVSYKAHARAHPVVPYLYRMGFALAQLNAAVTTMGTWPQHADASPTHLPAADVQPDEHQ